MTFSSSERRRDIDLEAQQVVSQPPMLEEEIRGCEKNETNVAFQVSMVSTAQDPDFKEQATGSQAAGDERSRCHGANIPQSKREKSTGHLLTQGTRGEIKTQGQTQPEREADPNPAIYHPSADDGPGPCSRDTDSEPEEIRMIGDFDGSANPLWTLYGSEAKSYDEARIQTLKDDMDGVLIFAGLFSATLTSFIIDSKQDLKASPADQMVYYLQQNVAILAQISQQVASIVPQVPIPSTPPSPFPAFSPSPSSIRVNVFWFMSLVFGLFAALLATLVQQWVRDYMHVFQRYSDPLKSARLRQYLHEGSEGWYMPVVAEAVPGVLHVSLFLFFVGLCDSVLHLDRTVGLSTTIPIGIGGLLYVFTTIAPVIYPQSPYQNSFSGLIWFVAQKLRRRRYKDRGLDGELRSVSSNMAEGQMQLAMEETEGRKGRDERAIRWLVDNLTEDAEMDLFVSVIPGSFNVEWGVEVWKNVSKVIDDEDNNTSEHELVVRQLTDTSFSTGTPMVVRPSRIRAIRSPFNSALRLVRTRSSTILPAHPLAPSPAPHPLHVHLPSISAHIQGEGVVRELSMRVAHFLESCKNRGLFASDELWRKRTRACVETTASLVCCTNTELSWFGDIKNLLGEIGIVEKTRESSLAGMDQSFVMRWTCLSLTAIRPILKDNMTLQSYARLGVKAFKQFQSEEGTDDEQAEKNAQEIDETFERAWTYLRQLYYALFRHGNPTEEQAQDILRGHEPQVTVLEYVKKEADRMIDADQWIHILQDTVQSSTHGIVHQLPGTDNFPSGNLSFSKTLNLFVDPLKLQFIPLQRSLSSVCSLCSKFRDILEGQKGQEYQATLKDLEALAKAPIWQNGLILRQLWRLQDLRDGGGLGFTVELFLLALRQLLSNSVSRDSHSALFVGTFRAITSDWAKYKHSLGTQKILLAVVTPFDGIFSRFNYPSYISDEFLVLLSNMLRGQSGSHINRAMQELSTNPTEFGAKVIAVISRSQARLS